MRFPTTLYFSLFIFMAWPSHSSCLGDSINGIEKLLIDNIGSLSLDQAFGELRSISALEKVSNERKTYLLIRVLEGLSKDFQTSEHYKALIHYASEHFGLSLDPFAYGVLGRQLNGGGPYNILLDSVEKIEVLSAVTLIRISKDLSVDNKLRELTAVRLSLSDLKMLRQEAFKNLTVLSLSRLNVTDILPYFNIGDFIPRLPALEKLRVQNSSLSEEFVLEFITVSGPRLKALIFKDNELDPAFIDELSAHEALRGLEILEIE